MSISRFRRARSLIATVWLVCEAAVLATSLIVLCADRADAAEEKCPHGHGAMCPMHKRTRPDPTRTGWTHCGEEKDSEFAVFGWLTIAADPEPQEASLTPAAPPAIVSPGDFDISSLRPAPPDPPPPHA
jgi:hypothetical protein